MLYNHVSNLVGTGIDALATIREQLASGKHRTAADFRRLSRHYRNYSAQTNERGVAIVRDIPLGGPKELESPTMVTFDVIREGYAPRGGPANDAYATAKLLPAQTAHVAVRLKKEAEAIQGAALPSELNGQQAAVTRDEGRLVAAAKPFAGNRDTEPALKPLEYSFHVVTTRNKPIAGAEVTVWAVGWQEGAAAAASRSTKNSFLRRRPMPTAWRRLSFRPREREGRWTCCGRPRKLGSIASRSPSTIRTIRFGTFTSASRANAASCSRTRQRWSFARTREQETGLLTHLYPVLAGAAFASEVADWSERDGVLTISRLDLTGEHAFGLLRVAEFPEKGPLLFSDLVDLKKHVEDPITLDLALKPGVRVKGRLNAQVPRPIKNGRVVAGIQTGHNDYGNKWMWHAMATIAADGTFLFESLPPDENLQLIALCDGWVSTSPTRAEVMKYAEANQFGVDYRGPMNGVVSPISFGSKGRQSSLSCPCGGRPTAKCTSPTKRTSRSRAHGSISARIRNGSTAEPRFSAQGVDYATVMRGQLASGVHTANPNFRAVREALPRADRRAGGRFGAKPARRGDR